MCLKFATECAAISTTAQNVFKNVVYTAGSCLKEGLKKELEGKPVETESADDSSIHSMKQLAKKRK